MSSEADQNHHPIGIYLKVWILLFVLSIASYMVDYWDFQGLLRWTLIIAFMLTRVSVDFSAELLNPSAG